MGKDQCDVRFWHLALMAVMSMSAYRGKADVPDALTDVCY